jgi:hypothetical protein
MCNWQLGTTRDQLCALHTAIGRLQRVINLSERRGADCAPVHKLVAALREHAAELSEYDTENREVHRRTSKLIGLIWQLQLIPWSVAVL